MSAEPAVLEQGRSLGKAWAAIRDDQAVDVISMVVPADVDFEEYRRQSIAKLELVGEVKSGELVTVGGRTYFVQRLTHVNRGKGPRSPKIYPVDVLP